MKKAPPTPKGFRDIGPELAQKRQRIINKIIGVLADFGFVPLETPNVEFAETLTGKYGEEERLIYKFRDRGGRDLALRFDLTVPLARFVANNQNLLRPSFSRYQLGQVFRGEKPQSGRWREFTQLDFDTVGSADLDEDARIIAAAIKAFRALGLADTAMFINDRASFSDFPAQVVRAIDKLPKVGEAGVATELETTGYSKQEITKFLEKIKDLKPSQNLKKVFQLLTEKYGLKENKDFIFTPTLARGLDYYTGTIFEMKAANDPRGLALGAGGRYDNLIGTFAKKQIPAVGFSFGIDRIVELLPNE